MYLDFFKLHSERHKYGVRWLAEFRDTHKGSCPIGILVRCVDPRLFKVTDTDCLSKLLGKIFEYKTVGAVISADDAMWRLLLSLYLENLENCLKANNVPTGIIIVESHSDCEAIKLVHSMFRKLVSKRSTSRKPVKISKSVKEKHRISFSSELINKFAPLSPIIQSVDIAFVKFMSSPEQVLKHVEDFVSEAILVAGSDIRERYGPESFDNNVIANYLKKRPSPYREAFGLHMYICVSHAMNQIISLVTDDAIRDLFLQGKLELVAGLYDVFSASQYYFTLRRIAIRESYGLLRRYVATSAMKFDVFSFFDRVI